MLLLRIYAFSESCLILLIIKIRVITESCHVQLNVNAILSVLLSSFTGFGIAISTNSLLVEYLRWRATRHPQSLPQQISSGVPSHRPQQNRQQHQQNRHHSDHNNRGLQTPVTLTRSSENTWGAAEYMSQGVGLKIWRPPFGLSASVFYETGGWCKDIRQPLQFSECLSLIVVRIYMLGFCSCYMLPLPIDL